MTSWILLVVVAQFLYAVVSILDKYIVTAGKISNPSKFAFYVGLLSSLTIIVFFFGWINLPFENIQIPSYENVSLPTFKVIVISFFSAITFLLALISLFSALKKADASDVVPVVGSASAVGSLFLSYIFLGSPLSHNFVIGCIFLIAGSLLVSLFHFGRKVLFLSLTAGFLFAFHYLFIKLVFNETLFDNGFFWTRITIAFVSLILFLIIKSPKGKKKVYHKEKRAEIGWVLLDKSVAGIASFLILKAIHLGPFAVIQALGSLQFAFLLVFAVFFGSKTPYACGENCSLRQRLQKTISIFVIIIGFLILFI